MNGNILDDLLRSLWPINKYPRLISWLLGLILAGLLGILIAYHIVGWNRDDLYRSQPIETTPFFFSAPQKTHAKAESYRLFIYTAPQPGNNITTTTTLTITESVGVVILPEQSLSFAFPPHVFQAVEVLYANDFTNRPTATIQFVLDTGVTGQISLAKERPWETFVRRFFIESTTSILLTTIIPAFILVLSLLATFRLKREMLQQIQDFERRVHAFDEDASKSTRSDFTQLAEEAERIKQQIRLSNVRLEKQDEERWQECLLNIDLLFVKYSVINGDLEDASNHVSRSKEALKNKLSKEMQTLLELFPDRDEAKVFSYHPPQQLLPGYLIWLKKKGWINRVSATSALQWLNGQQQGLYRIEPEIRVLLHLQSPFTPSSSQDHVAISALDIAIRYIAPLDLDPYVKLDESNAITCFIGKPGSGKTTTLQFLHHHRQKKGVLYLLCAEAQELQAGALPSGLERLLLQALLDTLMKDYYLWEFLSDASHQQLGIIMQRHQSLLTVALFEQLKALPCPAQKPLRAQRPGLLFRIQQSLRSDGAADERAGRSSRHQGGRTARAPGGRYVSRRHVAQAKRNHAAHEGSSGALGDMLTEMGFDGVCLSIDNASATFDYQAVQLFLHRLLPQRIYLRIAFGDEQVPPLTFAPVRLEWSHQQLEEIIAAVREQDQRWTVGLTPEVYTELLNNLTVPRDVFIWLFALHTCYPEQDVTLEAWQTLFAAMSTVRTKHRPHATNWLMEDWSEAKKVLGL